MKMDFRGVSGMGKTIEEKMREYNEVKDVLQNLSKNKEKNKRESGGTIRRVKGIIHYGSYKKNKIGSSRRMVLLHHVVQFIIF